jgi:hypothetical protein
MLISFNLEMITYYSLSLYEDPMTIDDGADV